MSRKERQQVLDRRERVCNIAYVNEGAYCLCQKYSFFPVFLANGEMIEARDTGKTLQEHVNLTRQ